MKDIDLDWSPLQYFTFQIFDRLSSPSIKSFEVDCVLDWNHYQYVAYYVSLPGIIFFLSIFKDLVTVNTPILAPSGPETVFLIK